MAVRFASWNLVWRALALLGEQARAGEYLPRRYFSRPLGVGIELGEQPRLRHSSIAGLSALGRLLISRWWQGRSLSATIDRAGTSDHSNH